MAETAGIRIHPRLLITRRAKGEIAEAWWKIIERHNLTNVEAVRILVEMIQQDHLVYMLREERHGRNSDKKADEA